MRGDFWWTVIRISWMTMRALFRWRRVLHSFSCWSVSIFLTGCLSIAAADDLRSDPFLVRHCYECHAKGANEGGLDIGLLENDLNDEVSFERWLRLFDRVDGRQMPPKDSRQPSEEERAAFVRRLGGPLWQTHAQLKETVLRRLNRREYSNTVNDIFGTNLKLDEMLPEDGRSHEFDNVGESLSISMVQMERYLEAIETVLDTAIAKSLDVPRVESIRASYAEMQEGKQFIGKQWLKLDDESVVFFRRLSYPTGMLRGANAKVAGYYRIRVTGYAYQSDVPVTFSVGSTTFERGVEKPTFGYYAMPPGSPDSKSSTTIELEAWLEHRHMIEIRPWGISDPNYEIKNQGIENYRGPGLAIQSVELEGPIHEMYPSRGHRLIYDGLTIRPLESSKNSDRRKAEAKIPWEVVSDDPEKDSEKVLLRVAEKAFRRPVVLGDIEIYRKLFTDQFEQSKSFDRSLRTAIAAIFTSPDFLYLHEPQGRLDDYPLASRLAYFLTRTAPDKRLLDAAKNGVLTRDRDTLISECERLLESPLSQRFVVDFTDAWLNLRDIDFTSPDQSLFPEHDAYLQASMLDETRSFVRELIDSNLGIRNWILSDFAMLNERLAAHYRIEGVSGPHVRRVLLPVGSVRGGLLSQASVLKVSANGTNTSPVVRGVWVSERIFGKTPDPPPPGIPGVEPDTRGTTTLRQLLDQHRDSDNCRACHAMIDPPGFALESFDPIGGWRDRFRSLGEGDKVSIEIDGRKVRYKLGPPVDSSGVLADGRSFENFEAFRQHLLADEAMLARAFLTKLMVFATGREMGFSDRTEIDRIVAEAAERGYPIRDLLSRVVTSDIFRHK